MKNIIKLIVSSTIALSFFLLIYFGMHYKHRIFPVFSSQKIADVRYQEIDLSEFRDGFHHARYRFENSVPPWKLYDPSQILGIADNMVYLQNPDGGWAKNLDYQRVYNLKQLLGIQFRNKSVRPVTYGFPQERGSSTLDNRNIYPQIRYLCKVYKVVKDKQGIDAQRYLDAAIRGTQWILNAQHPESGGFTGIDVYGITYNDDVMSGSLRLLRDIANGKDELAVLPAEMRVKAKEAYRRGIQCMLRNQITVTLADGAKLLTAWCLQYSHIPPFRPIWERQFEPPAICSRESYEVLRLLMEEPEPDEKMKTAIKAGCEFFDRKEIRISGKRIISKKIQPVLLNGRTYTTDHVMINDDSAGDLWARFYALDSGYDITAGAPKTIQGTYPSVLMPVWCDMGCRIKKTYNELSQERRNGYDYVNRGGYVLLEVYRQWKKKFL